MDAKFSAVVDEGNLQRPLYSSPEVPYTSSWMPSSAMALGRGLWITGKAESWSHPTLHDLTTPKQQGEKLSLFVY